MAVTLENVDVIKSTSGKELVVDDGLGGVGSHDFIATGSIGTGQTVGLKADGTVEVIADGTQTYTTSAGTPVVFESGAITYTIATFDSNSNKVLIVYSKKAVVGTVSGNSISFGTPTLFTNNNAVLISATFDSNSNKVVIAYKDASNSEYGTAVVGEVEGNSISFGSPVVFKSHVTQYLSATFDSNSSKVVIAYQDVVNSYNGAAIVGTVSGTSITFGNPVFFNSDHTYEISATFDSNSNKVVIAYQDYNRSQYGTARVGTVSGTSISFGSPVVFESARAGYISATFDSNSNKVVIAYNDGGNSYRGTAVVGTVSGNSISFGSPEVFESGFTEFISATFDSNTNRVVIAYVDRYNSQYGTAIVGTVSGTSISFGSPVVFESATTLYISATFDSNTNRVVIAYSDYGNSNRGTAVVFQAEGTGITTNADTWLGIAEDSAASGDKVPVSIYGGVASGLSGLTRGQEYYVNYDGSLVATPNEGVQTGTYGKIGKAVSPTKLQITSANL